MNMTMTGKIRYKVGPKVVTATAAGKASSILEPRHKVLISRGNIYLIT